MPRFGAPPPRVTFRRWARSSAAAGGGGASGGGGAAGGGGAGAAGVSAYGGCLRLLHPHPRAECDYCGEHDSHVARPGRVVVDQVLQHGEHETPGRQAHRHGAAREGLRFRSTFATWSRDPDEQGDQRQAHDNAQEAVPAAGRRRRDLDPVDLGADLLPGEKRVDQQEQAGAEDDLRAGGERFQVGHSLSFQFRRWASSDSRIACRKQDTTRHSFGAIGVWPAPYTGPVAKASVKFACTECGQSTARWLGQVPGLRLVRDAGRGGAAATADARARSWTARTPLRLDEVEIEVAARIPTGLTRARPRPRRRHRPGLARADRRRARASGSRRCS